MSLRHRPLRATLPFTLLALGVVEPAFAQTAAGDGEPAVTEAQPEEIVVTGSYARSLAAATETKRQAAFGVDSINSTDIGKFPAQNVAEALQLVSGVAITRPRGEGLYVSVRGLGPQFQSTLLNGRSVAINDLIENGGANGRQFRFEMLPAEFVSQIDVVKTPTADMTEGALGGNIDVKTFHPLDIGTKTTLNLRGTYTTLAEKVKPNATALTSFSNTDETLGLLIGAQYWGKGVRNDRWYQAGWNLDKFVADLGRGYYTPTRTRPTVETEDRKRLSGIVSTQWRPTAELETTLDVLATRLDVAYDEYGLDIYPDDPGTSIVPGSVKLDGNTVVGATINNVRFMASREYSLNRHDLITIGLKQSWKPEHWDISGNINWSYAHSFHPSYAEGTVRSRAMFLAPLTYDASGGYKVIPTFTTPVDVNNPANYVLYPFNIAPKNSKDWDTYARLDVGREMDGFLTKIAAGGEYHWRKRDYRRRDFNVTPPARTPLTSLPNGYEAMPFDNFLSGVSGNGPRHWVVPITSAFYDAFFTDAVANAPLTPGDQRASYVVTEKTASGYVRADYGFGLGGIDITGNLGVRYVHTDQVASGTLTIGTAPTPASFPQTFNNWLPSFNLRAELSPSLVARLAASRVLTRPNVTQSAPQISVSTDAPTASGGNPELQPFLATQFDGSLEWYFNRKGSLTGALFYKAMDDYITAQNINVEIPGRGTVLLSTQVNGGDAKVYGLEAAYNQVFDFLPAPFDGLGLQASYTHTSVEANYTAGARPIEDQLIGLSKNSFNVVGFYDYGPFSARLSYVWRDKYLAGTGSTTQAPTYVDAFGSLDGNLSFRLSDKTMLSLEAINIAGAKQYSYNDDELRYGEINYWGRTILFGVRTEF
ncbi:TonB-dependent receptor [Sphingomonas desiccabilis]|uniref:TonB-dependent receptor n=1 Tax=Sphingomonas desiccabilis TaxID=429134 RepID=A0A4Q2IKS1_9SPHN|nr:TonB-dependent receptor [Sphingomonas desiccabilis]MBB3912543.1 TonB-dependent receptor [Sphingomonas desiccabilis]RXZ29848.1 TonB-dependent receptor [Sphingomonas desiccabilis]